MALVVAAREIARFATCPLAAKRSSFQCSSFRIGDVYQGGSAPGAGTGVWKAHAVCALG
jgi:hypothetical protein